MNQYNHFLNSRESFPFEKLTKVQQTHYETLENFLYNPTLYFDSIASRQNTSANRYCDILSDFITDTNRCAKAIEKAFIALAQCKEYKIILDAPIFLGHEVSINNETLTSLSMKSSFDEYKTYIRDSANKFENLTMMTIALLPKDKRLETQQMLTALIHDKDPLLYLPNFRYYYFGELAKVSAHKKNKQNADVFSLFEYQENTSQNYVFYPLYRSCGLWEEKIIASKTQNVFIHEHNFSFEINLKNSCSVGKTTLSIEPYLELDCSMSYFIKKHLFELMTQTPMGDFIAIYKDYIAKEIFEREYCNNKKGFNAQHPKVIAIEHYNVMKNEIRNERKLYRERMVKLQKLIDFNEKSEFFFSESEWKQKIDPGLIFYMDDFFKVERFSSNYVFDQINTLTNDNISSIINRSIITSNDKFRKFLMLDASINKIVLQILDSIQGDATSAAYLEHDLTSFRSNAGRASIQQFLQNSVILDFRNQHNEVFNKIAIDLVKENEAFANLVNICRVCPYHDVFEIDLDILKSGSIFSFETLKTYISGINNLIFPLQKKSTFKLRKLGNHNALGIHFMHTNTLALDFRDERDGRSSYMHELAHHIDANSEHENREYMVKMLYNYFDRLITERRDYFLNDEELIARGAETAKILYLGNYKHLKDKVSAEALVSSIHYNFSQSIESSYMSALIEYECLPEYISIKKCILSGQTKILDDIYLYYQQFWNNRIVNFSVDNNLSFNSLDFKRAPVSSNYSLTSKYKTYLEDFDASELANNYAKFMLCQLPSPNLLSLDFFEENLSKIKDAWKMYQLKGKETLISYIFSRSEKLYINKRVIDQIFKDFEVQFRKEKKPEKSMDELRDFLKLLYVSM